MKVYVLLSTSLLVAACGEPRPTNVTATIARPCSEGVCEEDLAGEGLLVVADRPKAHDLAREAGDSTLYVELHAAGGRVVLVEIAFGAVHPQIRYRELKDGRVAFRGRIASAEVVEPSEHYPGTFAFTARDGEEQREVWGEVTLFGEFVHYEGGAYDGAEPAYAGGGCGTEIVVVDTVEPDPVIDEPVLPDDPIDPLDSIEPDPLDPSGSADPPPSAPPPEPSSPPPYGEGYASDYGDTGGCAGDDVDDDADRSDTGGCSGDDTDGEDAYSSDSGGCSGGDTDGEDAYSSDSGGCVGDDSESDSSDDAGESCEGDSAQAAAAPFALHAVRGFWSYLWPVLPAAAANRARRRRHGRARATR